MSLLGMVAAWEGLVRSGLVDRDLLPPPSGVAVALANLLAVPDFRRDLAETLLRSLAGLLAGAAIAIPLGAAMALYGPVRSLFEPIVKASYSLPKTSLIPLLILWFGIGTTTNVIAVMLSTLPPVLVYTYHGVEGVPKVLLWSATAMGTGPRELTWRVRLPAALPAILIGARVGLGFSLVIAIAAEMIASNRGVGRLIFIYGENGSYEAMFAAVFAVVLLAAAIDTGFSRLSRWLLRWSDDPAFNP